MRPETRDATIGRLLHDAEHAESGARMAQLMGDQRSARKLDDQRDALLVRAVALDPARHAPAWRETTLTTITQPEPRP